MIETILVDDHHMVREGLVALLQRTSDIEVVGEAASGREALELVAELNPEVVVMDISMPGMDGAQAARLLLSRQDPPAIVILSVYSDTMLIQDLVRQGIKGYLLKNSAPEELPLAVRSASQGELFLSPVICDSVLNNMMTYQGQNCPKRLADLLTPREREVLQLVSEGLTNNAIGDLLNISVKTVEKHRSNLMEKLEVQDLPALIRTAIQQGLIFLDQRRNS